MIDFKIPGLKDKKYKLKNNRKPTKGRRRLQRIPLFINNTTGNFVTSKEFNEDKKGVIVFAGFRSIVHEVPKSYFGTY